MSPSPAPIDRKLAAWLWGGLFLLGAVAYGRPPSSWKALEARHAVISAIEVEVGEVFDVTKPEEDVWFGRLANTLHKSTRPNVIQRALLFQVGDKVRERRIYETERLLRAMPFVKDAHIVPVVAADGTVVAKVQVRDAWTLKVNASFSSVGGQKSADMAVQEDNFMGHGKQVAFAVAKDQERSTWGFSYGDPQLFGSRWTLRVANQFMSDGFTRSFMLERPFFALDTPWATNLTASSHKADLLFYDQGKEIFRSPYRVDTFQVGAAWVLDGGDRVWRAGVLLRSNETRYGDLIVAPEPAPIPFLPPPWPNRRLRGPGLSLSTQKDAFDSFTDLQGMDTPEDYNLAWTGSLAVGEYLRPWGSTETAPFLEVNLANGWSRNERNLGLFTASWKGRRGPNGMEDAHLDLALTQYHKVTDAQILAAYGAFSASRHPDPENWYDLGALQGLRGYPNHLHPGDGRWQTSLEYRMLTQKRWWGMLRLGFLAFADVGAIHRMDGEGWSRAYSDVGLGIRLGNLKSSMGRVIQFTVAVPLNRQAGQPGYQLAVGNVLQF